MTRKRKARRPRTPTERDARRVGTRLSPGRAPWLLILLGAVAVLVPTALFGVIYVSAHLRRVGQGKLVAFELPPNPSAAELGQVLAEQGLIDHRWMFFLYRATLGHATPLMPGEHLVSDELSPAQLLLQLARSTGRPRVQLTIPEGFEHQRIAARLFDKGICSRESFVAAVHAKPLLKELGIEAPSVEGYLFPDTYQFFVNERAEDVVRRLVAETRRRLAQLEATTPRRTRSESELLTLASLIEKEAMLDEERPLIASVFENRLADTDFRPVRMLQSDPTAAYGCMVTRPLLESCGTLPLLGPPPVTPRMLRDRANPYNTYLHPGLPPGPIANPGKASILAALMPAQTDYLFFVAIGGKRHRFSRSFEEHRRAITGSAAPH